MGNTTDLTEENSTEYALEVLRELHHLFSNELSDTISSAHAAVTNGRISTGIRLIERVRVLSTYLFALNMGHVYITGHSAIPGHAQFILSACDRIRKYDEALSEEAPPNAH